MVAELHMVIQPVSQRVPRREPVAPIRRRRRRRRQPRLGRE